MVSRRIYVSITALMVSILFLCMSLTHMKDGLNDYAVNRYTETAENYPSKVSAYRPFHFGKEDSSDETAIQRVETTSVPDHLVAYIGNSTDDSREIALEWITYTKRDIVEDSSLTVSFLDTMKDSLEMLIINSSSLPWSNETVDILDQFLENGISLIFCGLPDLTLIKSDERVRNLLGIQSVRSDEIEVDGFYLREGFLLGGSTFYLESTKEDEEAPLPGSQAFPTQRNLPWLTPATGTKVYMRGIFQEDTSDPEENPILIWRTTRKNGYVFVENGDFMSTSAGMGLLSAMAYEMHPYELYPIVNTQTIILTGFPILSDENTEIMNQVYSRSIKQVDQELIWPPVSELLKRYGYKATCMIAPQYDYADNQSPDEKLLKYYLKMFAEQSVEAGLDGQNNSNTPLLKKLKQDEEFFDQALKDGYDIVSFYARDLEDEQLLQGLETKALASTRTVVKEDEKSKVSPVDFLSEDITSQSVLCDGLDWTYENDFLIRSMETALGYLNVSFDLSQIAYPLDEKITWPQLSGKMASTIDTYGQLYSNFSKTTAAQADERIRQFLTMNFNQSRVDDQIKIELENSNAPAWFILRTHNEAIDEMEGGNFIELEKGAYLIEVTENNAILKMKPFDQRYIQ